jgi:amidase
VALFRQAPGFAANPSVAAALEAAAGWLGAAGFQVEEATPPHFEEAAVLWRTLVHDDMRRSGLPAMEAFGDEAVRTKYRYVIAGMSELDRDRYLDALARRVGIARAWSLFLDRYPVLLMPVSWQRPFPIGADTASQESVEAVLRAQSPLLATAMLGLPGLSVPTGLQDGLPTGVQLVAARFREDLCLLAGAAIERAAGPLAPLLAERLARA